MFTNADEVLKFIGDQKVEFVDVRFCDLPGTVQHFTVPVESFLAEGRQEPGDLARLTYGQSITDACMDVDTTSGVLGELAAARRRRATAR